MSRYAALISLFLWLSAAALSQERPGGEPQWNQEYVCSLFDGRKLEPIEGVWQFPDDGATIVIVKHKSTTFDIFLLDSPKLSIRPGTLIGSAVVSPKNNYYDGSLNSASLGQKARIGSQNVTFTVGSNGTLAVRPYSTGVKVSFRRWMSYFLKFSIMDNNKRPHDLDGARRIYPHKLSDSYPVCL